MNKRRMLNGLIGLLLLLSACSSPKPAAVLPPTSTTLPAASPTLPPPTATFTSLPPTNTPLPTATQGPTATQAPTNTPAPTADPLHTACDHPYNPMRLGAVWLYKYTTGPYTATVTAVTGDSTKAQATLTEQFSNGDVWQFQYVCDPDGFSIGSSSAKYANGTVGNSDIVTSTGHYLLAADKLTAGAKWSYSQTVDGFTPNKVLINGTVGYKPAHHHDTSIRDCTVAKIETLKLAVGTFPVVRVNCRGTDFYNTNGEASTFPANDQWVYALGPGLNPETIISYHIP